MKFRRTADFFGRFSIARQGMILVGVLIFFELIFCGSLYWQVVQAEQEARREEHYKKILETTMQLPILVNDSLENLMKYAIFRKKEYAEKYDADAGKVLHSLKWLEKQLAKKEHCLEIFQKINGRLGKGIELMNEAKAEFDQTSSIQNAIDVLNSKKESFQKDWTFMIKNVLLLSTLEQKIVEETHPEQRRLRRLMQTILAAGILANIVFAIVFARFFAKTITSRLAVMIDNTSRFQAGKELNLPVKGKDELSELDGSFHAMASAVMEAQRMRQTFVAMISHDLRTPLTNVQAYLSLVSEGILGEVPALVKTEAEKTEANVSRLIRLINDLLTLEKMEAGKMQMSCKVVYLESLIEKSIEAIDEFAKGHDVKLEFEETNVELYADPDRLMQVLINLASNAVKFSPKGGTVRIVSIEDPDFVEVQVIDQGRGVPEAYRETIFEKYKQVKTEDGTKKGGTGLGLPICKMIVEQLGGSIGVRSEEGKGSTFWFKLPLKASEPTEAATA